MRRFRSPDKMTGTERKGIMKRLMKETGRIKWGMVWVCVLSAVAMTANLIAPKYLSDILDTLNAYNGEGNLLSEIGNALILLTVVYALYSVIMYFRMLLSNKVVSRHFTARLRMDMSTKIKYLPVSYVDKTDAGQMLDRMTADVSQMGNSIHAIIETLLMGILQLIAITVIIFTINWVLALIVIAFVPMSVVLSYIFAKRSEPYYDKMFKASGDIYQTVEETYSGYQTIKSYNLESLQEEKLKLHNDAMCSSQTRATFMSSIVTPLVTFSNNLAYVLICLIGAYFAIKGTSVGGNVVSVADIVAVVIYAKMFSSPLEQIANAISSLQRVASASKRVYEVLDEPEMDVQTEVMPENVKGVVDFEHVAFSYNPENPLLKDMNVHVEAGSKVAIVGPTGAGKTTVVNLLMRFYDPQSGSILIDGTDTKTVSRESVRDCFSMVLQDTWLFGGSVYDNIAYGKEGVSREDVERAAIAAHADAFIRMLPDGYDTVINESVTNISGGQKQLLTIARAFLSDKPLLILDEATSSVDTRTEVLIQKAMDDLMKNKTGFIIAHRLSTIVNADVILVIKDGDIVESGTHKELLAKNGFYAEIYNAQYKFA